MPVYSFTHPVEAVGLWATALDALGNTVATALLVESDGSAVVDFTLPTGSYRCRVDAIDSELSSTVLDDATIEESAGGGGTTDTVSRGTLYLKASCVDADASTEEWASADGVVLGLTLDTDRQGSTPIPDWAEETEGVYSITEPGAYVACIAGKGSITYDSTPASVYVDIYHNDMSGVNWGWSSDGTDDSEAFTVAATTDLDFGCKDSSANTLDSATFPVSLAGLVADNYGPVTNNPIVTLDARLSVTKLGSGTRFTAADFE